MWPFEVRLHIVACNRGSPSTDTSFTPKCLHLILKHVRMFVTWLHGQVSQCFGGLIKHVQVAVSRNLSKFHRPNEGSTINRDSLYSPCLRDFRIYTMVQTSNKSDLQHQYQCFSTCIKGTSTVTHTQHCEVTTAAGGRHNYEATKVQQDPNLDGDRGSLFARFVSQRIAAYSK